ncbi:unnamed protein product [Euphydryas editha]|uniref:Uncharacterized protein n=1 Tax=Euphydryas editha TaxID=104508 RepID=A0AAU9TXF2_EUPED|nr:unnamed protein product [Euphydryas editha]
MAADSPRAARAAHCRPAPPASRPPHARRAASHSPRARPRAASGGPRCRFSYLCCQKFPDWTSYVLSK